MLVLAALLLMQGAGEWYYRRVCFWYSLYSVWPIWCSFCPEGWCKLTRVSIRIKGPVMLGLLFGLLNSIAVDVNCKLCERGLKNLESLVWVRRISFYFLVCFALVLSLEFPTSSTFCLNWSSCRVRKVVLWLFGGQKSLKRATASGKHLQWLLGCCSCRDVVLSGTHNFNLWKLFFSFYRTFLHVKAWYHQDFIAVSILFFCSSKRKFLKEACSCMLANWTTL